MLLGRRVVFRERLHRLGKETCLRASWGGGSEKIEFGSFGGGQIVTEGYLGGERKYHGEGQPPLFKRHEDRAREGPIRDGFFDAAGG